VKDSLFSRSITRSKMFVKIATISLLLVVFVALGSTLQAAEKPSGRFTTGWLSSAALESTRCTYNWLYNGMGAAFTMLTYDQLWWIGPGPDYEPQPWVATSWETPDDGKTWIFHLRKDAKFHDGTPLTAKDVVFTMEYLTKSVPAFKWHGTMIEEGSAKAIDDYTVTFTLPTPLGGKYPAAFWIPILPKHIFEPYKDDITKFPNEKAIGSGPYKLKEFKSGEYMWFVANENHFSGAPKLAEVVFRTYGSADAQIMAMKKGEIQMFGYAGTSPTVAGRLESNENIAVYVNPGQEVHFFAFNLYKQGPIRDLNVRKALMHGINKKRISDIVYKGQAELIDSVVYPELADHNPNLAGYDYNPEKANTLLKEAGYVDSNGDGIRNDPKTGKELSLELIFTSSDSTLVRAMQMVAEQLKEVGINIVLEGQDDSTHSARLTAPDKHNWDLSPTVLSPGPYGDWAWEVGRSWEGGGKGWNYANYANPEFDKALDTMLGERDPAKRKELLFGMQQTWNDDLPFGFLWRPKTFDPVRTDMIQDYSKAMGGLSIWWNPWTYFNARTK